MKINVLIESSHTSLHGGGQRSIALILKHLNKEKFNPILLCPKEGELADLAKEQNIKTIFYYLPRISFLKIFGISSVVNGLKNILQEESISIIHTESTRACFYFGLMAHDLKIPLIHHVRVCHSEKYFYEKGIFRFANHIIAVSNAAKLRFARFKRSSEKTSVIYNAVDTTLFHPGISSENGLKEQFGSTDKICIGILGELVSLKGHETFLKAASLALKQDQNLRFFIIGSGDVRYKRKLENYVLKNSLEKYVFFLEHVDNVQEIFSSLDIVVNASNLEGFSRIIIEAMACGVSVIASNVGGNPEAVKDGQTGLLFEKNSAQDLAKAILDLTDEKQRKRLSDNASEYVQKHFTIEDQIRKVQQIYSDVYTSCKKSN
jgi:glycosyltransferase involved in cell wall biosynthesis